MKAFKLASAFAITGLALAVSGQAMAADTTTDWTWDGKVVFSADLMNTTNGGSVGSRGANGDSTANIDVDIAVANGGFSGMFKIDSSDAHDEISISGVRYDEGAISFGDIGSMNSTEGYISGMKGDLSYTADQAFRYTMDNGFAVQAQGGVTYESDDDSSPMLAASDLGVALAYTGEFEGGSFAVDVEYAENGMVATDDALDMYTGFGVTMAASDAVTVKAAYTAGINAESSMGVRADFAGEAFNAYGEWVDEVITVGADTTMGIANLYVDYTVDGDQNVGVKLASTSGNMSWGANVDMELNTPNRNSYGANVGVDAGMIQYAAAYAVREDTTSEITASATHTTEGGAVLSLAYENDNGTSSDSDDSDYTLNTLVATASYSF
jgi:hypothetical protein